MKRYFFSPISMFLMGLILGVVSRLLDIYTQNLGNLFSQLAVWILFGVLISIYSKTKKQAMQNIVAFCVGMLITYYLVAFFSKGVYGSTFIVGWTVFAFASPVLAYFTWMTKEKGVFPKVIGVAIVLVSVLSSVVLFDGFRAYDLIIDGMMVYFLFFKKIER